MRSRSTCTSRTSKTRCLLCGSPESRFIHRSEDRHGIREFHECAVCDLAFVPPQFHLPSDEEVERYKMHDNDPDDPGYRAFLSRLWDVLRPRLRENAVGLDYGCGPGPALASMIREDGFAVEKYDLYFFPDRAPLQQKYDFIACTETIEHLRRPMEVFTLLSSMLAESGHIGVMTGVLDDRSKFGDWYYQRDPTHIAFYSHATFRWVANRFRWGVDFPAPNVAVFTKQV